MVSVSSSRSRGTGSQAATKGGSSGTIYRRVSTPVRRTWLGPPPYPPRKGEGQVPEASLERPDSLRPYELSLPNDSQMPLCGRGLGGKPVSPASLTETAARVPPPVPCRPDLRL